MYRSDLEYEINPMIEACARSRMEIFNLFLPFFVVDHTNSWMKYMEVLIHVGFISAIRAIFRAFPTIDVNAKDETGMTILHYAVISTPPRYFASFGYMKGRVTQSVAILRFLLSHPGIDVNCRDDYGYTPYQRSWSEEVPQIIKVFQDTPGCDPLDFVIKVIYCILIDK